MGRSLISKSILNELFPVLTFVVWGLFLPGKFSLEHEVLCVCSSPLPVNQGEPVKGRWRGGGSSFSLCCKKGGTDPPVPWFIWLFISHTVIQQVLGNKQPIQPVEIYAFISKVEADSSLLPWKDVFGHNTQLKQTTYLTIFILKNRY